MFQSADMDDRKGGLPVMGNQNALHVAAPVRLSQRHVLEHNLAETAKIGFSFDKLDGVHFARLVLVPGAFNKSGEWLSDSLVLATNFDGDHELALLKNIY